MRKSLLIAVMAAGLLMPLAVQMASAAEPMATKIAMNNYQAPLGERLKQLVNPNNALRTAFCGQCTKNSDCGVGYRCVGRPECMECKKAP